MVESGGDHGVIYTPGSRSSSSSSSSSGYGDTMQCHHRPWSDLPDDILFSIASRLARVECIRFMNVCKGWLHSIKPRGHHRNHNNLKPCLLAMENSDLGWLSLYTPFPSKTYKLRIPELKKTMFRYSKDGWILLSKSSPFDPSLFLLNLLTGAKFDLPDLIIPTYFCGVCFTSTPGSSDFMVVVIRSLLIDRVTIYTYRPSLKEEKEEWTTECYENSCSTTTTDIVFLSVSCNPIFYKGQFYCLDNYGHLGIYNPVRKDWRIVSDRPNYFLVNPPPPDPKPWDPRLFDIHPALRNFPYKSYMVDLEGDLISVFVNKSETKTETATTTKKTEKEVHIFRLDCCKMGWEKVDSLGTGELFVGLPTCISTIEVPYGSWNKLYFPAFKINHRDNKNKTRTSYYYEAYSLETKVYDPSCSSCFWGDYLKFTWIELPISKAMFGWGENQNPIKGGF